jgi:O-antigen/teichoic acid export membrane protein
MTIWGLVFFVLAFLQGIQQEIVRLTSSGQRSQVPLQRRDEPAVVTWWWRSLPFVVLLATGVAIALVVREALPAESTGWLTVALTMGMPFLVAHQVFNGALAGSRLWGYYSVSIVVESFARFGLVVVVVALGVGLVGQTWALVFGGLGWCSLMILGQVRSSVARLRGIDPRVVAINASGSLIATGASALLINAFPVLLQLSGGAEQTAETGVVIAAVLLTRAPLLMPLYALQGMTIATLTGRRGRMAPTVAVMLAVVAAVTLVGSLAAAWLGPWLLELVFGAAYQVSGWFLASLIAGAGLTAALTIGGWAALSAGRHRLYAVAWLCAPVAAVVMLNRAGPVDVRAATALIAAPLVGLAVLALGSLARRGSTSGSGARKDHEPA